MQEFAYIVDLMKIAVEDAHPHPLNNPALNTGVNFIGTGVTGGTDTGGRFKAGDRPAIMFQLKNDAGADMSTLILTDRRFLAHESGIGHPESPARLRAILSDLERAPPGGVVIEEPRAATSAEIDAVHNPAHRQLLEGLAGRQTRLDPDTAMSAGSWAFPVTTLPSRPSLGSSSSRGTTT